MLKQMSNKMRQMSWLGGAVLLGRLEQAGQPPDPTQNNVAIVIVILAIALPFLVGGGIALVTWLISLGTPTPLVAVEQKKIVKREILPEGVHMPPPSGRPLVLALGLTLVCAGLILRSVAINLSETFSLPIILVIGGLVTVIGLGGWIGDDLRARKGH